MKKETGGPAFPQPDMVDDGVLIAQGDRGMDLRDYFAAKAMQALLTRETKFNPDLMMYAGASYDVADAMLKARSK